MGLNDVRKDPVPEDGSRPRRETQQHIAAQLDRDGHTHHGTVGAGVGFVVGALEAGLGEAGSRDVGRQVFMDPSLASAYSTRANSSAAYDAHRHIARNDDAYWNQQHAANPTPGSQFAAGIGVPARTYTQMAASMASQGNEHYRRGNDPTGHVRTATYGDTYTPSQSSATQPAYGSGHRSSNSSSHNKGPTRK